MKGALAQGDIIDGFRLEKRLHVSALGVIWQVTRADVEIPVIMKLPILRMGDDPLAIVGYEAEQMILQRLSGPHVPKFIAAGDFDGPYVVMELIAGRSLKDRLPDLPLAPAEVADIGARIADALENVHAQRVIHLDLKPSNVMLRDNGEAVLLDYGLSRHLDLPDIPGEEIDGPFGTGAYISPEQLLGVRHDPRSDLFSLGVLLYFFATGERPYGEPVRIKQWRRRLYMAPAPPRRWKPDLPPWLQEIILHCLEINPAARYQSAAHLAFDLRHPEAVALTARAERTAKGGILSAIGRWLKSTRSRVVLVPEPAPLVTGAAIILVAVDLSEEQEAVGKALIKAVERMLKAEPDARLACVNVLKLSRVMPDENEDAEGRNFHLLRLAELKHWSAPLNKLQNSVTYHVIEAIDAGSAILDFAVRNNVHHVVMGARTASGLRRYLGSVSSKVVAEAPCSVTVVRA